MSKDFPSFDEKFSIALIECRVRCLVLGGVACNIYGSTRMSEDTDLWIDPSRGLDCWLRQIEIAIEKCGQPCRLVRLRDQSVLGCYDKDHHARVSLDKLREAVELDAVIRLQNETGKLDAFFMPHQLDDFEAAWNRSTSWDESLRVLSISDLLQTKQGTGRQKDRVDIQFLESLSKPSL